MTMGEWFLNTEEEETIRKALVFYNEHPEYNDDSNSGTVREMIDAFGGTPIEPSEFD